MAYPKPTLALVTALLVVPLWTCDSPAPVSGPFTPEIAKGGNGNGGGGGGGSKDPSVSSVEPDSVVQGQVLDVLVNGDGFEPGTEVDWLIDGSPTVDVQTNSTTFLSKRKLRANITVDSEAATTFYDARVTTPPGRRGIGSEVLQVTEDVPIMVTMRDAAGDEVVSDGEGSYVTDACGDALFNLGDALTRLFRPAKGKKNRAECPIARQLRFSGFPEDSPGGPDRTGRLMSIEDVQGIPVGVTRDVTAGFSVEGCPLNLHFDPARGGSVVSVTRVSLDTWTVTTKAAPDNVAVCPDSEGNIKFSLNMDFGATIVIVP